MLGRIARRSRIQISEQNAESATCGRPLVRVLGAAAGVGLAASLFGATGALAQNCVGGASPVGNSLGLIGSISGVASMVGASISATSTAFLLQSSSFIGSPPNPAPDQPGGGVWVRGVGGEVSVTSSSANTGTFVPVGGGAAITAAPSTCSQKVDENFAGVQFGQDIAKLNVNGWNLHLGGTAGVLTSSGSLVGGAFSFLDPVTTPPTAAGGGPFTSSTQVPFFGIYGAATNGGFFIDGLLREEYYQSTLTAPGDNLFGQPLDAHGWSFSSSAGYNWAVPNSKWFVEPSGSLLISRTTVDPLAFTTAGIVLPSGTDQIPGTLQLNQINSDIGRVGLRVGETVDAGNIVWQPFVAASVWHEFGPNITASYASSPGCCVFNQTGTGSLTTIGTFGQYSLGVSASVPGTGWLGFARVDYRDGSQLEGLSGTGGIRYQFSPEPGGSVMPTKAPLYKAPPAVAGVNWSGFYIGGFGSADLGTANWNYLTGAVSPHIGGFGGGGDIGYNWQTGAWVLGVEGDMEGLNNKGGEACNAGAASPGSGLPGAGVMFLTTCNASDSWIAEVTGRVGYTWGRALLFVRAGGAWTDERFSATCNNLSAATFITCTNPTGGTTTGFSASADRGGWVIGYGSEFALTPNWSARGETDYVSFGNTNFTANPGAIPINAGMNFWEAKVGLNYRFSTAAIATRD